jgi:ferric-dicitrate binding protein FerR (iron transport regulator)
LREFESFAFGRQWQIDCENADCLIEISSMCRNSAAEAIKAWNTRATPHAEAVRVLSAALKRLTVEITTGWDDDHHPFADEVSQAYQAQEHPAVVAAMDG